MSRKKRRPSEKKINTDSVANRGSKRIQSRNLKRKWKFVRDRIALDEEAHEARSAMHDAI
jgi:hypothetical protein